MVEVKNHFLIFIYLFILAFVEPSCGGRNLFRNVSFRPFWPLGGDLAEGRGSGSLSLDSGGIGVGWSGASPF